jgi:hypothetical protein
MYWSCTALVHDLLVHAGQVPTSSTVKTRASKPQSLNASMPQCLNASKPQCLGWCPPTLSSACRPSGLPLLPLPLPASSASARRLCLSAPTSMRPVTNKTIEQWKWLRVPPLQDPGLGHDRHREKHREKHFPLSWEHQKASCFSIDASILVRPPAIPPLPHAPIKSNRFPTLQTAWLITSSISIPG